MPSLCGPRVPLRPLLESDAPTLVPRKCRAKARQRDAVRHSAARVGRRGRLHALAKDRPRELEDGDRGIVRSERIAADGRKRNSVRLSIIDDDWPEVRRVLAHGSRFDGSADHIATSRGRHRA